ncbi:MAG TPA: DNA polymerase/3'-5' exonuclease PolX, partial [candidate division Zixibacteria bacterium]|nr:DNA polymerase/3'-5' exonuclease PolX [candidate division Zixibacteria bacterium]
MTNQQIAKIFEHIADILEIQGENVFKIGAYRRAAETIANFAGDISNLSEKELSELPGIGKAIAQKTRELVETGKLKYYEELKKSEYAPLVELLQIQSVGPKHARLLYDRLGVKSISDLEKAAKQGKIRNLPGMGKKTEENILKGISALRKHKERIPIGEILPKVEIVFAELKKLKEVKDILIAGSLRRFKETIGDADILIASEKPKPIMDAFVKLPQVARVLAQGETKSSIVTEDGFQVDLRVVEPDSFGAAAHYFTGSKAHNVKIRTMAVRKGIKVNEYGIFKGKRRIASKTEEEVYKSLGMIWIPPEMREDWGEIELALKHKIPTLVELKDIKGDLQMHSTWSDGWNSIEEMAQAGIDCGYEYIAITDHSPTLGITQGLTEDRLYKQIEEIRKINKKYKNFRILSGIEVDVRENGQLDLPNSVLNELDIVVASIHTKFNLPKEQMTKRIIKALENEVVDILGHPTGRLLGKREPFLVDMEKIIEAAKANKKV